MKTVAIWQLVAIQYSDGKPVSVTDTNRPVQYEMASVAIMLSASASKGLECVLEWMQA